MAQKERRKTGRKNAPPKNRRYAFVSGGSRGIGKAIVQTLQKNGYWVAACSSRADGVKQLAPADLRLHCDVSDPAHVLRAVRDTLYHVPHLDLLVNNAGVVENIAFKSVRDDAAWLRSIGVNINGPYFMVRHFLPALRKGGSIINISSILGLKGVPDAAAYCASKHAMIGFTRSLAHFVGPKGLTANAICPGWTDTEMGTERMRQIRVSKSQAAAMAPTGRIATPADIAAAVLFLASPAARQINGHALVVDGGFLA